VKGIEKLPPAHWLEWRDGNSGAALIEEQLYSREAPQLESAGEELDTLLRESVREHLAADVP